MATSFSRVEVISHNIEVKSGYQFQFMYEQKVKTGSIYESKLVVSAEKIKLDNGFDLFAKLYRRN